MTSHCENQVNLTQREISIWDAIDFLKSAWKTIVITALVGLALSATYLALTPKQYEATAQISMAQISATSNGINPLGVNIEEPTFLIARMSSPTTFTPEVIATCGWRDHANAALALSKSIKLTISKGVTNLVELKTLGATPQGAEQCALAIFELIRSTQSQIVAPYITAAKMKLADDIKSLEKARSLLARADKSGAPIDAAYLSTRDEIRYFLDEINALQNVLASNQNRATRLASPIYAGSTPIAPNKWNILAAGLFGGLFLGLLIAIMCIQIANLKNESGGES